MVSASNTTGDSVSIGIGINSTTAPTGPVVYQTIGVVSGDIFCMSTRYSGFPGIGRTFMPWLEVSPAQGTATWYGANTIGGNASTPTNGIFGHGRF